MLSVIKGIFAPITILFKFVRSLLIYRVRLNGMLASNFFDLVTSQGKVYTFEEEFVVDELPKQYDAVGMMDGMPFRFMIEERLLRAGWRGTEVMIYVKFFRFHKKRVIELLKKCGEMISGDLPVYLLGQYGSMKMGSLAKAKEIDLPYLEMRQYNDIIEDIEAIANKTLDKFGTILYGPPGNGKSWLVRYLVIKYQLPLHIVALDNDWSNADVLRNLSQVEGPAVLLIEDFDNHFDKRQPLRKTKFSFDSILNALDGAFTVAKNVAVFMTVNDLEKVDEALKNRPSRFKYVREIPNPSSQIIKRIFDGQNLNGNVPLPAAQSLDILLHARDIVAQGHSIDVALAEASQYSKYVRESRVLEALAVVEEDEDEKNGALVTKKAK